MHCIEYRKWFDLLIIIRITKNMFGSRNFTYMYEREMWNCLRTAAAALYTSRCGMLHIGNGIALAIYIMPAINPIYCWHFG